jgi:hypothetical protein
MGTGLKRWLAIFLICGGMAQAAETSVHWRELGPLIAGNKVSLILDNDRKVKGTGISVEGDSLTLDTRKGKQILARRSIHEIRVARKHGYKWRAIGAAIGAGVGVGIAIPVLAETHNEGSSQYDGAAAALIGGLAAIGYLAGWFDDRSGDVIRLLPD